MVLLPLKHFCFCCDLRRGCVVYTWLQMMIVTMVGAKYQWVNDIAKQTYRVPWYIMVSGPVALLMSIMIALQLIKAVCGAVLIWGIVKNNHMFYQPWLFINGLENAVLVLMTIATFVIACMKPFYFWFVPLFAVLAVFGWYTWACVFVLYKRDMKPNVVGFDANYDNFNMNNFNIHV